MPDKKGMETTYADPKWTAPIAPTAPAADAADPTDGPLTPEHMQELALAKQRSRKLLKAVKVATFNGWCAAIFAACALPFAPFSATALVMAVGLAAVAWNEFRGRRLLRSFDPRGPRVLGWNQLGFMGLLIGYSLWSIYSSLGAGGAYESYMSDPQLGPMLESFSGLYRTITIAVYGGVIAGALIFQGLTARYYFARCKHLQAYLDETPDWVVELQRCSPEL